jgi:hypothetical protein
VQSRPEEYNRPGAEKAQSQLEEYNQPGAEKAQSQPEEYSRPGEEQGQSRLEDCNRPGELATEKAVPESARSRPEENNRAEVVRVGYKRCQTGHSRTMKSVLP